MSLILSLTHSLTHSLHSLAPLTHSLTYSLTHSLHSLTHSTHSLHPLTPLTHSLTRDDSHHFNIPRRRRSTRASRQGLRRALSPLMPLAHFLVAGTVPRASRRGCGARCRRWCRLLSSSWQAQSPEPSQKKRRRALSPLVPLLQCDSEPMRSLVLQITMAVVRNHSGSPFWRPQYPAPAATTRGAPHQRQQRAQQPCLEALGTATRKATGTSRDKARRSPFCEGSAYCACRESDLQTIAVQGKFPFVLRQMHPNIIRRGCSLAWRNPWRVVATSSKDW